MTRFDLRATLHNKLMSETKALLEVNRNFVEMGLSYDQADNNLFEANRSEAIDKLIFVQRGLKYLVEELKRD
jgi:hypothetical protein